MKPLGFQPLKKTTAQWTQGVMWVVAGAQMVQAFVAFLYWQAFSSWDDGIGSLNDAVSAENTYNAVSTINGLLWLTGFIFLVVWSAQVHTTTTSLLSPQTSRKYSRTWAIWVWFIPVANFISAPQVIAENQKLAYAPRRNNEVDRSWMSTELKPELIWWWLLVIGGFITTQVGSSMVAAAFTSSRDYLTGVTAIIVGSGISAFGVALGARFIMDMNEKLVA
jgi:hypothetical protein